MTKFLRDNKARLIHTLLAIAIVFSTAGCDPCFTNPCDNNVFCDGVEVCTASESSFTCTEGTSPCDSGTICSEESDTCVNCSTNDDCDDNNVCTGLELCDLSTQRCVAGMPIDCDDVDLCTTDMCDPLSGLCTNTPVDCLSTEYCSPNSGLCIEVCTTDADCEDGLFCNGTNTCDIASGICINGANPCTLGQTCDETTDSCACSCDPFFFTSDTVVGDAMTGTFGDDIFWAPIGTLQAIDIAVGNGGNDTLNATIADSTASLVTLIDIDNINITTQNDAIFDTTNCEQIGSWNAMTGSVGSLTLTNLEANPVLTLSSTYDQKLSAKLADASGSSNQISMTLNGTAKGATINTPDDANLELLFIDIASDSWLTAASPGVSFFGSSAAIVNTILSGSGNLTLDGGNATDLAADGINVFLYDGELTISPAPASGPLTFDFYSLGFSNVNTYIVNDTTTQNHTLTFDPDDSSVTINVTSLPAATAMGALTVEQGSGGDSLRINLVGSGSGIGEITATNTGLVTIFSGGTTSNAVASLSTYSPGGFIKGSLSIIGVQNLNLGTVSSRTVDASAFSGDLTVLAINKITIEGGTGDDSITGGEGADTITGGSGNDTFVYISVTDTGDSNTIPSNSLAAQTAGLDVILDFTEGDDIIALDGAMTAGANFVFGSAGSSVVTTLTANTVYVLTGVGPGGSDAIIYMNNTNSDLGGGSATFADATLEIYIVGGNSITWTAADFTF